MDSLRLAGIAVSGGLVLIAVVLAIVGGDAGPEAESAGGARLATETELEELESTLRHPVFWVGERPAHRLELKQDAEGNVYLRYLPEGVGAGDPGRSYLTVGTYPVTGAEAALKRAAAEAGTVVHRLRSGAILLADPASPDSAYVAYPGTDFQIEVYDPQPGRARALVESGLVKPVGERR